jgi:SAM-dependent methyltransferase
MTRGTEPAVSEGLKQSVVAHYERQLRSHGPTARGMDWKDEASQRLRFAMLCGVCDLDGKSLCELGCGVGHLYDWLREQRIDARYTGIDLSEEMVAQARRRHPAVSFARRDVLLDPVRDVYDVVVCSGLFHVKLDHPEDDWRPFVDAVVRRMYAMSRVGIAFNLMSDQVDFRSPTLFYANPAWILDLCRRELSRFVVVRHDYPLHEYTVYVYRQSPVG